VKDFEPKFRIISELQRIGERAFIHKLKQRRPNISSLEIAAEVANWYLVKPPTAPEEGLISRSNRSEITTENR
jgi:hypothetical protein